MDAVALDNLRVRYQAVRSAESVPRLREFYYAITTSHDHMAREAYITLQKAERMIQRFVA